MLRASEPDRVQNMNTPLNMNHCHFIESVKPADAVAIWMHGLGATAHDFDDIIPYLHAIPSLQSIRFIFPQAPQRSVTRNQGFVMPAWYDIFEVSRYAKQDEAGIKQSAQIITALIEEQIQLGIKPQRIFLIGFSQGGAMALYTSLHYPDILAGVIGMSCYLPLVDEVKLAANINCHNHYWIAQGTEDLVVTNEFAVESVEALRALGCDVSFKNYDIGHEICKSEIDDMAHWMQQRLTVDE